jgi:nitroreductase
MTPIFIRRSIRKFSDRPVEKEKLERLLKAAMQAPSAGNQQPWEFIVVDDKEILECLSALSPYALPLKGAPLAIIALGNTEHFLFPENWQMDMSAAVENILLEAVSLGLGAVWLGVAPLEDRMLLVRDVFELPENIIPFAAIPVGYPAQPNKYVNRYKKERVHHNKF